MGSLLIRCVNHLFINPIPGEGGEFYHRIPEGMANLPELIFPRRNCAVGMKLCIFNNYHKNFLFPSKKLHGCVTSAFFSACVSKNRHFSSFSLATLNASQFGPKYDTDHFDCNMFLEDEIK